MNISIDLLRSIARVQHRFGRAAALPAIVLCAAWLGAGCAAHTSLEPVGKGNLNLNASIGGPIAEVGGVDIPLPYLTAGGDYGLDDNLNASGTVHLLPLAYGIIGLEAGGTWFPIASKGSGPTIGLGVRLLGLISVKDLNGEDRVRVYPVVTTTGAWKLGAGDLYAGTDVAFRITQATYDSDARRVILSPFIGYRWDLGANYRLLTELKWQGANVESHQLAVTYTKIAGHGAIAPLIAIERRF